LPCCSDPSFPSPFLYSLVPTQAIIKKGYYKLSKQWHPDKHMADPDAKRRSKIMFQRVSDAYEALSDIEKRAIYDHDLRQRWKEETRKNRDACDKDWFGKVTPSAHPPRRSLAVHSYCHLL